MTDIEIVDVMIKQGKLSDALQTLTHMIDKPTQPSAQLLPMLLKRAQVFYRAQLYEEASRDALRIVSMKPSQEFTLPALICLGQAFLYLKKFERSKLAFKQAQQLGAMTAEQQGAIEQGLSLLSQNQGKESSEDEQTEDDDEEDQEMPNTKQQQPTQQQQQQPVQQQQPTMVPTKSSEHVHKVLLDVSSNMAEKDVSDLECSLCYRIFYQPITLSCGHTFDRACLSRVFDYTNKCPLCREVMHIIPDQYPISVSLNNIVQKYFKSEYDQRAQEEQMASTVDKNNIPIFILDYVLYPHTQLSLHVFEPRYRLMMRRCMAGSRSFGLVAYGHDGGIAKYGTMAKISNMQLLPDGRSLIETVGERRFMILDTWEQDGYTCGRVEWIDEQQVTLEEEQTVVKGLADQSFALANQVMNTVGQQTRQQIETKIGKIPPANKPEELSFWLCALLSLSVLPANEKLVVLKQTSTKARLEYVLPVTQAVFNQFKNSASCAVM